MLRNWVRSACLGMAALFTVNMAGTFTGVTLGYGWICILVGGVLGFPGIMLLTIIEGIIK